MSKEITNGNTPVFEQIKRVDNEGNEYWSARDLSKVLDYFEYRNFKPVIEKAKEACRNSGQNVGDHFVDFHEMVKIGSGAERGFDDGIKLSRYACYLIVQNASPEKEVVALGQTYFAVQTRLQEIQQMDDYNRLSTEDEKRLFLRKEMAEHNKYLADAARSAGVIDPVDYYISEFWL